MVRIKGKADKQAAFSVSENLPLAFDISAIEAIRSLLSRPYWEGCGLSKKSLARSRSLSCVAVKGLRLTTSRTHLSPGTGCAIHSMRDRNFCHSICCSTLFDTETFNRWFDIVTFESCLTWTGIDLVRRSWTSRVMSASEVLGPARQDLRLSHPWRTAYEAL